MTIKLVQFPLFASDSGVLEQPVPKRSRDQKDKTGGDQAHLIRIVGRAIAEAYWHGTHSLIGLVPVGGHEGRAIIIITGHVLIEGGVVPLGRDIEADHIKEGGGPLDRIHSYMVQSPVPAHPIAPPRNGHLEHTQVKRMVIVVLPPVIADQRKGSVLGIVLEECLRDPLDLPISAEKLGMIVLSLIAHRVAHLVQAIKVEEEGPPSGLGELLFHLAMHHHLEGGRGEPSDRIVVAESLVHSPLVLGEDRDCVSILELEDIQERSVVRKLGGHIAHIITLAPVFLGCCCVHVT